MKTKIKINGMICHHCEMKVKNALSEINNISVVKISAKKGEAIITHKNLIDEIILEKIVKKINEAGYEFVSLI